MKQHVAKTLILASVIALTAGGCASTQGNGGGRFNGSDLMAIIGTGVEVVGTIYTFRQANKMYGDMMEQTRDMHEQLGTMEASTWAR